MNNAHPCFEWYIPSESPILWEFLKGLFPSPYTATEPTGSVAEYGYITETAHIVRSPYTATEPVLCEMVR